MAIITYLELPKYFTIQCFNISIALFVCDTIYNKEGCSIESATPVNTSSLLLSHVLFTFNQLLTCHILNKYNRH